jgi:iron complex outermembrane receptor protein
MTKTLVFLLLAGTLTAQSISGTVKDPQNKAVAGAAISLFSTGDLVASTTSDASGAFRLTGINPGEYILQAFAPGFGRFVAEHVRVETNLTLDLKLEIAAAHDEVVVTASTTPQTAEEVSKSISVLDAESIDRRDDAQLTEAIRPEPGVRVQQLGGPGSLVTVRIRGLRDQDTAVVIDGMRLRDAAATQGDASSFIQDMLVTDLNRVEILRGPGSSLYGTNAIGGVVNVITNDGGGATHGSLLMEGGSLGLMRGRAQIAGGFDRDRIIYSAGLSELDVTDGIDGGSPGRTLNGQGRVAFRISPSTQIVARFYGANSFDAVASGPVAIGNFSLTGITPAVELAASQVRLYEAGVPASEFATGNATFIPSVNDPDSWRVARFLSGAVTLTGHPAQAFGYSIAYQGLSTTRTFNNGPAGTGYQPDDSTRSDYDGEVHTINAHFDYELHRTNLITAGYEFEDERYGSYSFAPLDLAATSLANVSQLSHAAFAQDQIRLLDNRLQISIGVRAQTFSLEAPRFTPLATAPYQNTAFAAPPNAYTGDASAAYSLRKSGTKLRAHAGRGYRAPSLYERFGAGWDETFGYSVYGDPRLRPERSLGFDAGIDQAMWNRRLQLSATYFYTRLQDVIAFDFSGLIDAATDPWGRYAGYLNTKGGLARGAEFSARLTPTHSLDIFAAYTYTNAIEREPIVGDVLRSFVAPRNQVGVIATQRLGSRWFVSFDLTAASSYLGEVFGDTGTAAMLFPGIKKVDAGISYRIPLSESRAIRLFANASNLANQKYFESGYATPGITGIGGLQLQF